jgi:hypothetical protein
MIKISHSVTSDSPDGQPWPPPDSTTLWAVVRRTDGCTLWRTIQVVEVRSAALDFCKFSKAATATKDSPMTRDEVFPSKYLKAADLKGEPRIVMIESAHYETLKGLDGKETQKIVLYFKNLPKSLPLNVTNFGAVCDATGFLDTDDWPGQQIELYPTRTSMGGQLVDCIRIRRPSSRPRAAVSPPPPPTRPVGEMNDEIPW